MNSLDLARQGKSAARQIRSQMNAGVLTAAELDRLLAKVEAGFDQMVPGPDFAPTARTLTPPKGHVLTVIEGDRI